MGQNLAHRRRSRLPDSLPRLSWPYVGDDGRRHVAGTRLRQRAIQHRLAGYHRKPAPAALPALHLRRHHAATDAHRWLQARPHKAGAPHRPLVDTAPVAVLPVMLAIAPVAILSVGAGVVWVGGGDACFPLVPPKSQRTASSTGYGGRRKRPLPASTPPPPLQIGRP